MRDSLSPEPPAAPGVGRLGLRPLPLRREDVDRARDAATPDQLASEMADHSLMAYRDGRWFLDRHLARIDLDLSEALARVRLEAFLASGAPIPRAAAQ